MIPAKSRLADEHRHSGVSHKVVNTDAETDYCFEEANELGNRTSHRTRNEPGFAENPSYARERAVYQITWQDAAVWKKHGGDQSLPAPGRDPYVVAAGLLCWEEHCVE